ncbi:glycosyltransferase family 2 protein [Larsenimonas suaedae]|uniref:Glycosyltransferase family 2 protein n=1 Tax=Larsenimonas suaedae TaxID=1851019 RepID=A0ABU1GXN7_9GAMM|nr:glycosyltransferase family 2 protein [Larsenimonas suaedae]MCM2971557.1 glycosyltransferase [Larsenimonas suaedae]MDR5896813.1 glycosyltransferase family 2 protein [Larsenimonas suaedae]
MDASVVIPTYKSSSFIKKTIDSVFSAADTASTEIILVDDCSDDAESLEAIVAEYSNVTLIHKPEKSNAAASRNMGIEAAVGEVVFLLDSDDAFERNHIQKRLKMHREEGAEFIFGGFIERAERDHVFVDSIGKVPARDYLFVHDGDFRTSTISMSRKEYMNGTLNKHQDWGFFLDIDDKGIDWRYDSDASVVLYVDRGTNMSSSLNIQASEFFISHYLTDKRHITGFCKRQFLTSIVAAHESGFTFFSRHMRLSYLSPQLKVVKLTGDMARRVGVFKTYCRILCNFRKNH